MSGAKVHFATKFWLYELKTLDEVEIERTNRKKLMGK